MVQLEKVSYRGPAISRYTPFDFL